MLAVRLAGSRGHAAHAMTALRQFWGAPRTARASTSNRCGWRRTRGGSADYTPADWDDDHPEAVRPDVGPLEAVGVLR